MTAIEFTCEGLTEFEDYASLFNMFLDGAPDSCQAFGDFESLQNLLCSQDYNSGDGGEQGPDTDNGEITVATTEPLEPLEEGMLVLQSY